MGTPSQRNITDDAEDTHMDSEDDETDWESWNPFSIDLCKENFA